VFGTPSITTRQSKHTPMPQNTPSTVVRVAITPGVFEPMDPWCATRRSR
jgi:hypothetical protein